MKRIKVETTYLNVDDEFLDWYVESILPNADIARDAFFRGEPITYTSKDPYGDGLATTTWQVVEEYDQ